MPGPLLSDVHISVPLTNISIAYQQRPSRFIASRVFPVIPVQKQSDKYWTYPKGDWFRTEMQKRARASATPGSGWRTSSDLYSCDPWGVHKDISDLERANADSPFNLDAQAARFLARQSLLRQDKEWVAKYFKTGVWDTDLSGVTASPTAGQFLRFDVPGSTPIELFEDQRTEFVRATGYEPNTLVLGPYVWKALKNHSQFLDRIKYTQTGQVTLGIVSSMLEVERVMVAYAIENTANEGQTTSMSFVTGKHALLCYSEPEPGREMPSAGYTFAWDGLFGAAAFGGTVGGRIKRFRMEDISSDRVEIEAAWDMKKVAGDLGVFFSNAVS